MPGVFDPAPPVIVDTPAPEPEPLQSAATDYYQRLTPIAQPDPEHGYALMALADALTSPVQLVHEITRATATREPFATVLHPAEAPAALLPWLAQTAGVELLPADTDEQARDRIEQAAGLYAGTERALREEVARTLQSLDPAAVRVVYPTRWEMTVLTRTADTPNPAAAECAALRQVPAGTILTYLVTDDPVWLEAGDAITWDDVTAATTWDDITTADIT